MLARRPFILAICVLLLACAGKNGSQPPVTGGSGGQSSGGVGGTTGGVGGAGGVSGSAGHSGAGGVGGAGSGGAGAGGLGGAGGSQLDAQVPMDASGGMGGEGGSDAGSSLAARICEAGASYGEPLPPEDMRVATLVMGGFGFIEGPVWLDKQGVLLFSDMDFGASPAPLGPPSRVRRLTPPSTFDVLVESGNTNGLAVQLDGQVLGCAHDVQSLVLIDPVSAVRTPIGTTAADGKHFNSPNDLAIHSNGTVYFTDPDWQLPPRTSETGIMGVYRVPTSGPVELITSALVKPNGIALSPDERTLYVGSQGNDIWKHAVNEDGTVEDGSVFVSPGGSDGLGMDCAGNLYVTSGGEVRVFGADGMPRGAISVAENPSNVAFGGAEHKTLYITAQSGLYRIELNVPGMPY